MDKREKVIKGLECCSVEQSCLECPWQGKDCNDRLHLAALELLKEQEAVEPILKRKGKSKMYNDYVCPVCDNEVVYEQCYCSECGKPFLWEGR